ncbi:kelch repeat and BTB domain-containing protein 13-like isoform X1 [Myxocyprinus asiaticus]|uniref:kelch repeat and BTB domain-containing protein 13-like isoform X1 n=1 Tax=Myxocyprinus asiaticus TaxID=70543 RepID=UPI00222143EB|nr:kelch repeat and BTB domain-containing protein 13-like isoform X1 [Myxocyprinus asiaticus]
MGPPCSLDQSRNSVTRIEDSGEGQDEESTRVLRVRVEESVFPIDRAVLWQKCEYFRALFRSGMKDSQQSEFHLQGGLKARGFLIAMAVFRGEQPVIRDPDEIVEAVECAAFLQVDVLVQHLTDILDTDNCILMYHTASVYGLWRLFHNAAAFIRDAYFDLQEAVKALPEDMVCHVESLSPASFVALGTHSPSMKILQDSYRTVFYLDEKQGAWKYLTDLPTDASTSMAGVAVVGNRLYIVGGVRGVSKETVDLSFSYDTETNTWSVFDGPQQSRYNFTLVGHNEHLYAIGGEFDKRIMSSVEVCDVSTGAWTFCKHAPRSVAGVASAVARRRIFVCFWKPPDTTDIYEYVPSNDEWTLTTTMVKPQSYGHCMVAHGDNLYVMRNGPCDDFLRCLMDCYNITTGQWTAIPGHYVNSRGALFTAVVRGDSAFTVNRNLTLEFLICGDKWKPRRQMMGFPKSGSLWTCLLRLPKSKDIQKEIEEEEAMVIDVNVESVEALVEANYPP